MGNNVQGTADYPGWLTQKQERITQLKEDVKRLHANITILEQQREDANKLVSELRLDNFKLQNENLSLVLQNDILSKKMGVLMRQLEEHQANPDRYRAMVKAVAETIAKCDKENSDETTSSTHAD